MTDCESPVALPSAPQPRCPLQYPPFCQRGKPSPSPPTYLPLPHHEALPQPAHPPRRSDGCRETKIRPENPPLQSRHPHAAQWADDEEPAGRADPTGMRYESSGPGCPRLMNGLPAAEMCRRRRERALRDRRYAVQEPGEVSLVWLRTCMCFSFSFSFGLRGLVIMATKTLVGPVPRVCRRSSSSGRPTLFAKGTCDPGAGLFLCGLVG